MKSPFFTSGLVVKRSEARCATNTAAPLTETRTLGGSRMAVDSQYRDSVPQDNQNNCERWKSIGEIAKRLVEKAGGK